MENLMIWLSIFLFGVGLYLEIASFVSILLALYWMYQNTSTLPKEKGKLSAYSVFNKGQEKIDGTLSSQQIEAEIFKKMY